MTEHLALPLYVKAIKANVEEQAAKTEALGYAVCDRNQEFLTDSLPMTVCKELVHICNKHYYNLLHQRTTETLGQIILSAVIPIEPVELPQERVLLKNRLGNVVATMPRWYTKYQNDFYKYVYESDMFVSEKIPIDEKCQVTAYFYTSEVNHKSVSAYTESLLDCLVHSGIIASKSRHTVNNTDGCRAFTDEKSPRIEIVIRRMENGNDRTCARKDAFGHHVE